MRTAILLAWLSLSHGGIITGPYLQSVTESGATVCFETADSTRCWTTFTLKNGAPSTPLVTEGTRHEASRALLPDTVYDYRVNLEDDSVGPYEFRSPGPGTTLFRFAVIGDTRTDSVSHQSVVDRIAATSPAPALVFHAGDLTEYATDGEYRTYFNINRELLSRMPEWPVPGNHDYNLIDNWFRFFVLPGNELWYSVRWGNCVFVGIDTYSPFEPGSDQYLWLAAELDTARADTSVTYIFAILHEPPYTTCLEHGSNLLVREYLCPLFERHRTSLAFQGHNHVYEHSYVNGVHHIISGGGGAPLHSNWGDVQPWTVYRETCHEFTLVDVMGSTLLSRGVRADGTEFDTLWLSRPGVKEEAKKNRLQTADRPPSVMRGSAGQQMSGTMFDATGRPARSPRAGVFFVRTPTSVRKVLIVR